jgi:hypothetical protein
VNIFGTGVTTQHFVHVSIDSLNSAVANRKRPERGRVGGWTLQNGGQAVMCMVKGKVKVVPVLN